LNVFLFVKIFLLG